MRKKKMSATNRIAELTAIRDHEQFYLNYFNFIVSLAQQNHVELDNPRLLQCFDKAYELAVYGVPQIVDPQELNDRIGLFFGKIVDLIR